MPETLVKRDITVGDTIALILARINHDSQQPFAQLLAKELQISPADIPGSTKRIFDYVCRNVHYKMDDAPKEKVFNPARTVVDGIGDCKKMTVLIGSVLLAGGIESLIKHVFYKNENYTHVYIIVPYPRWPDYITVDPVNDKRYNSEVNYESSQVFNTKGTRMDLYTGQKPRKVYRFVQPVQQSVNALDDDMNVITGCTMGAAEMQTVYENLFAVDPELGTSGIGKRKKKTKEERKERRKKVLSKFKNVGLSVPRGSFLALVSINAFKLASKLAILWNRDPRKVENFWRNIGGDPVKLKNAIVTGSNRKPVKGMGNYEGTGVAVATLAATAVPITIAVLQLLKDSGVVIPGSSDYEDIDDAIDTGEDSVEDGSVDPVKAGQGKGDGSYGDYPIDDSGVKDNQGGGNLPKVQPPPSNLPPAPTNLTNPPVPAPNLGNFSSPLGIAFKCTFLSMVWQQQLPADSLSYVIVGLIGTYGVLAFIFAPFAEGMFGRPRCTWYFDGPVNLFYSLFTLPKKIRYGFKTSF